MPTRLPFSDPGMNPALVPDIYASPTNALQPPSTTAMDLILPSFTFQVLRSSVGVVAIPARVTRLLVHLVGAGGAGGNPSGSVFTPNAGGGGGAGAEILALFVVDPATTVINFVCGGGAIAAPSPGFAGGTGGASTIAVGATLLSAGGGQGGQVRTVTANLDSHAAGGAGGIASISGTTSPGGGAGSAEGDVLYAFDGQPGAAGYAAGGSNGPKALGGDGGSTSLCMSNRGLGVSGTLPMAVTGLDGVDGGGGTGGSIGVSATSLAAGGRGGDGLIILHFLFGPN